MKTNLPIAEVEAPFPKGRYIVSRTDLKGAINYGNDTFVDMSKNGDHYWVEAPAWSRISVRTKLNGLVLPFYPLSMPSGTQGA